MQVIHNGIETDFFRPGLSRQSHEQERDISLLYVGNFIRRKGADLLPGIMALLGPGYELRYTRGLRTKDPFDGAPGMTPLGRLSRSELRDEYRSADMLVFPSRFEGFGYAVAESMSCGTPVVTSRCSSLPELVEDGLTGRLCPVDDIDAFAAAVHECTQSPDRLQEMGEKAREVALKRFDIQRMAGQYDDLLSRLCRST